MSYIKRAIEEIQAKGWKVNNASLKNYQNLKKKKMKPIIEIKKNGKTLQIFQDDNAANPREAWDNLGIMVCFHKRYILGDKTDYKSSDYSSFDELEEAIREEEKPLAILPVYMYDHSGITINTTGFSCPWDSGQIGYAYITQQKIDEMGCHIKDNESFEEYTERLKKMLIAEVETYDQYLTGDVYGFSLTDENDKEDSCWGFYGDDWKTNGLADYINDPELVNELLNNIS